MATIIHAHSIRLTADTRAHLARRLTLALRRFESRINQVQVFIKDINGSGKGGVDQSVLIKVDLHGPGPVVVEHVSHDLFAAISIAARRAKRSVKRTLRQYHRLERRKLRELDYQPSQMLAAAPTSSSRSPVG